MGKLELVQLTKRFAGHLAVDHIDFTAEDGEFVVLVGPSGCGKSTTLRMIAGLESITEGDLFLDQKRLNDDHASARNMAMVFQNYALYPHMSVFENIAFGMRVRKVPRKAIKENVARAAEILQLQDLLHRKPGELSGGQKQRVAIGRALVRDPEVFLMDEPLSNLDAKLRNHMRTEIKELQRTLHTTTVYVTHDQVEAMTLGDKIVVMKDGNVQQIGSPIDLYNRPANRFVGSFIGSPPMNFVEGVLVEQEAQLKLRTSMHDIHLADSARIPLREYAGRKLLLGVRAEDLSISSAADPLTYAFPVKNTEILGKESLIYFTCANELWIAKLYGQYLFTEGEAIFLQIDPANIHLYDQESQRRLDDLYQVTKENDEQKPNGRQII